MNMLKENILIYVGKFSHFSLVAPQGKAINGGQKLIGLQQKRLKSKKKNSARKRRR